MYISYLCIDNRKHYIKIKEGKQIEKNASGETIENKEENDQK